MSDKQQESVHLDTPIGKLGVNGNNLNLFFTVIGATLSGISIYILIAHRDDSRDTFKSIVTDIRAQWKETNEINREMLRAIREQSCLLSIPQSKLEKDFSGSESWCKRITR